MKARTRLKWVPWIAFLLVLFSFRSLVGFDPASDSRLEGADRFLFDTTASSPGLIFALSGFFLVSRRHRFAAAIAAKGAPVSATLALGSAAILFGWACYVDLSYLLVPSLTLLLLGGSLLVGGVPAFRVMLFPALFLLLALPLATVFVNQISYWMQVTNAGVTESVLDIMGFRAASLGDHIYYDRRIFQVIEACTGLRTVQTLFMAAVVYIEIFGRRGSRAWLLVIFSPFVGIVINEIRILSIVLNPHSAITAVHTVQGLVMIAGGVLLLAAIDGFLGLWIRSEPPRDDPAAFERADPSVWNRRWRILAGIAVSLGLASVFLPSWNPPNLGQPMIGLLSSDHDGWVVTERLPVDVEFLGSTRFDQKQLRTYEKGEETIRVFMGTDYGLTGSNRALSPKTTVPGGGWEVVTQGEGGIPGGHWAIARSLREKRLIYHKNINMASFSVELARALFGLGRGPFRRPGRHSVIRISTPIADRPDGLAQAAASLDRFLASFEEPLSSYDVFGPSLTARP